MTGQMLHVLRATLKSIGLKSSALTLYEEESLQLVFTSLAYLPVFLLFICKSTLLFHLVRKRLFYVFDLGNQ